MEHCQFFRLTATQRVHHIKGEIEFLLVLESDSSQLAVFLGGNDEIAVNPQMLILGVGCGFHRSNGACLLVFTGSGITKHNGVERAVLAIHSNHTVRYGRIVINTVAGV